MAAKVHARNDSGAANAASDGKMTANERKRECKARTSTFTHKLKRAPGVAWRMVSGVGREDPRRAIHSVKVGVSLVLVSLLYLIEPLYERTEGKAIWTIVTVVLVFESTAGATLCRGLNRGLGTVLAGALAFFVEYVSHETSKVARAVFVGLAVFLIGALSTYTRFFPAIKKNYDYGVVIFLLNFNLITVSSYRIENIINVAHQRFCMIAIGCAVCLVMSIVIFPLWSSDELHNATVAKLEGLARSFEACVTEYFSEVRIGGDGRDETSEDPIYKGLNIVLHSKANDKAQQALYASWEPRYKRNCCVSPWHQYVKLGAVLRHFGYNVVALHGCLRTEIQTPLAVRALLKDPCTRVAREVAKILLELANSVRNRRHCSPELLLDHLHESLHDLNNAIKTPKLFLGSNDSQSSNMLAFAEASSCGEKKGQGHEGGVSLSSVKTDTSAQIEWKTKREAAEQQQHPIRDRESERKVLRQQLRKIAATSLEFSEALPFAAFASLVVETVARLELVIEEVLELGRLACFKEYQPEDGNISIKCEQPQPQPQPRAGSP
ncbi:hypothetical protein MLD38_020827 [Melastoma candidum]|uniref:Uncharacterized protein n=1 Tax=Melastoma candidum TaxID=119954 RepID=A0ACB9QEN1_9MYRT|nr:hypothetical protein MLD38_020827 [Melastoma candidum]